MKNINKYSINDILARIRNEKGFSQECMANILNISQANYSKIENGQVKLNLDSFIDICIAFDVSIEEVLLRADPSLNITFKNEKIRLSDINLQTSRSKEPLKKINHVIEKMILSSQSLIDLILENKSRISKMGGANIEPKK